MHALFADIGGQKDLTSRSPTTTAPSPVTAPTGHCRSPGHAPGCLPGYARIPGWHVDSGAVSDTVFDPANGVWLVDSEIVPLHTCLPGRTGCGYCHTVPGSQCSHRWLASRLIYPAVLLPHW